MVIMLFATFGFAVAHALVRALSREVPPFEVAFFRNLFGLLVLAPLYLQYGRAVLHTQHLRLHLLRVGLSVASLLSFYYALSLSPLGAVTAIGFIAPLLTTLIAAVWLHEVVRAYRWTAIITGFVGAMIVLRPSATGFDLGLIVMLGSTILFAVSLVVMKLLTRTDSAVTITAYNLLLQTPLSLIPALAVWRAPSTQAIAGMLAVGVLSAVSVLAFTSAMKSQDTSLIMPLDNLRLVWTVMLGYLIFAEVPDLVSAAGMVLIVAAAGYVAYRDRQLAN